MMRLAVYCSPLVLLALCWTTAWAVPPSLISGHIVDEAQVPLPNAQVFMEQGLLAPLVRVTSDEKGYFEFSHVLPGKVGVIAHSPGHAFNGFTASVGTGDIRTDKTIVLPPSGQVVGRVTNTRKKPLAQASITRVLLQQAMVGIPYTKLKEYGFQIPSSDAKGQFMIVDLPTKETVALKVDHAKHAQGIVVGIDVGAAGATVELSPGVLVSGSIQTNDSKASVPNAAIIFRNIHPPRDTTIAQSGSDGVYLLRLKPGEYSYEAIGASHISATKPLILITGEQATAEINLIVAPKVVVEGKIMDALSGKGIAGARVLLEINGTPSAKGVTGSEGLYSFSAPAGSATIRFLQAPGYLPPQLTSFTMALNVAEKAVAPTFWLTTLPVYSLAVVDAQQQAVAQAVVQVLDPPQFGWRTTDAQGMVSITLGSLPKSGRVVGYVEHSAQASGAAFSIGLKDAQEAIVQLISQRTLKGRVVNAQNQGLAGWTVSCQIAQEGSPTPITLWSTITDPEGRFQYPGVLEGVPLLYAASHEDDGSLQTSTPALFTLNADSSDTLPDLVALEGKSGKTLIGKKFPWRSLSGDTLSETAEWKGDRIVVFSPAQQAPFVLESLERQQEILAPLNKRLVLVTDNALGLSSTQIPIYTGTAPSSASVYILSKDDRILVESNELPPLSHLRNPTPLP